MNQFRSLLGLTLVVLLLAACAQGAKSSGQDEGLFKINGEVVTTKSLSNRHRMALFQADQQRYQAVQGSLDRIVAERLMEMEAKKQGISMEELRKKEVDAKVSPVSDVEIDDFLKQNKARIDNHLKNIPKGQKKPSNAELKQMIAKQMGQRRAQERHQTYLAELRSSQQVEYLLKAPEAPRVDIGVGQNNPEKGDKNAKVTIVEFSDFQCPYCARAVPVLREIEEAYGDKVRVVFRDFPLDFHQSAKRQAEAAQCANDQTKFWTYHDKLFEAQDRISAAFGAGDQAALDKALTTLAKEVGMNETEFAACIASGKHSQNIEADVRDGEDAGVSSTPSFFVNGKLVAGALPFAEFKKLIDTELGRN